MTKSATSHLLPVFARVDLGFERGEGAWLIATNGERYLDFTSGVAVNALGHAHPHLVEAITEQAKKVWHVSNLYRIPEGERLAGRLWAARFAAGVVFGHSGAGGQARRGSLPARVVLGQFRLRGYEMRDQDGAQVSVRERQARTLPYYYV